MSRCPVGRVRDGAICLLPRDHAGLCRFDDLRAHDVLVTVTVLGEDGELAVTESVSGKTEGTSGKYGLSETCSDLARDAAQMVRADLGLGDE